MKKLSILIAFLFIVCFSGVNTVAAQKKSATLGDLRVTNALNQTKTPFTVDNNGLYVIIYELPNKRHQKILISSETEKYGDIELRLVFSYASISSKQATPELAIQLLQKNMEQISTWALHKSNDGEHSVVNMMYIPADLEGKKLDVIMTKIAFNADELEERLTKKDEL